MSALWLLADAETQAYDDEIARRAYATFQLNVTRQELRDECALRGAPEVKHVGDAVLSGVQYDEDAAGGADHHCRVGRGGNSAPFRAPLSPLDGRTERRVRASPPPTAWAAEGLRDTPGRRPDWLPVVVPHKDALGLILGRQGGGRARRARDVAPVRGAA